MNNIFTGISIPTPMFQQADSARAGQTVGETKDLTQEALMEGLRYLKRLPQRDYSLGKDGKIYIGTSGNSRPRIIDQAKQNETQSGKIQNTLLRELTVLIKGAKDKYVASDGSIKSFAKLLLRIASDESKRNFLKEINSKYHSVIHGKFQAEDITAEIENTSERAWNECITQLELSAEDIALIERG